MPETADDNVMPAEQPRTKREIATARILEAARERFPEPEFIVDDDPTGTVWVKLADGSRSVGLAAWLLREKTAEEVLKSAEDKLGLSGE